VFIAFTDAGKQLMQRPSFWTIMMLGLATWSLVTVAWGLAKGRIEPFARGFDRTYERDTEPKRYWASMAWNAAFGGLFFWLALTTSLPTGGQPLQLRCYNAGGAYSVSEVASACDSLLAESNARIRAHPDDARAYFNRGFVYEHQGKLQDAIADFSEVIRLRPDDPGAYYYRRAAYIDLGDSEHANSDLATLKRLSPQAAASLQGNRVD
jgi:tetratricopeptide (TPR) repeat protein